jgi:hypothetical protein
MNKHAELGILEPLWHRTAVDALPGRPIRFCAFKKLHAVKQKNASIHFFMVSDLLCGCLIE